VTGVDDLAGLGVSLTERIEAQITLVEKRIATLRRVLQRVPDDAHVAPIAEIVASEAIQLTMLTARLDQHTEMMKEI
jgi:hypothetical protein